MVSSAASWHGSAAARAWCDVHVVTQMLVVTGLVQICCQQHRMCNQPNHTCSMLFPAIKSLGLSMHSAHSFASTRMHCTQATKAPQKQKPQAASCQPPAS
mmetsp:Transcript_9109/g.22583  ORF Transcript_9109/g.22583 Transcript_9109/m.22583 type:complete len:100 (-) Transcript_9109:925-1224(-)